MPQLEHIVVMSGYEAPQPPKSVMTWETLRRLGPRQRRGAQVARWPSAWRRPRPERRRLDRLHLRHHRPAQGRGADARQPRRRPDRLQDGDAGRGGLGAPAVPAARPLVRAAGVVPRRRPRPHHGLRREPRQARATTCRRRARTSSAACRASSRRSTRACSPARRPARPLKRKIFHWAVAVGTRRQPPPAARPAGAGRPRAQAPDRPQARVLEAPRARWAAGCSGPSRAARRCRATSPSSSTRPASCSWRATASPRRARP